MGLKPVIAFALLLLLSGCGTLRISVDYGSTPTPSNPASTSDFAGTLGALSTWTPTPTISPTATTAQTGTPTQAVTAPVDEGIVAVSSIQDHTCALTGAGRVKCWGNNEHGQLGNGTLVNSNVPVDVSGLADAVAIAAGWKHSCALTKAGAVLCWGYNRNGELGNGKTTDSSVPAQVVGLAGDVTAIGLGDDHACAVTAAGRVKCWGYNEFGQLGDGTMTARNTPVDMQGLISKVAKIAAGWGHTCALTDGGGVKCWGNNQYGQLGYGQPADYRLTAVDVFELTFGAAAASAGGGQTCALTPGGGILCWGNNKYGQLGDGTGEKRNVPTAVAGITQGAAKVVTGWNHTCAVMGNGELQCWGWNYYGQLGNGNRTSQSKPVNSKRLMENVRDVAAGWSHTCAVTVDGGVLCWGSNQYGQLGDGTNIDSSEPLVVVGLGGSGASSTAPQTATATQTGKTPSPMYGPTPTATPAEPTRTSSKPTYTITPTRLPG
jgi:alpha-tubulin suppressor-like RCC1 family protein